VRSTYFYHDHTAYNRGDGLQGALIVRPPGTKIGQGLPAQEKVLFLQDCEWMMGRSIWLGFWGRGVSGCGV